MSKDGQLEVAQNTLARLKRDIHTARNEPEEVDRILSRLTLKPSRIEAGGQQPETAPNRRLEAPKLRAHSLADAKEIENGLAAGRSSQQSAADILLKPAEHEDIAPSCAACSHQPVTAVMAIAATPATQSETDGKALELEQSITVGSCPDAEKFGICVGKQTWRIPKTWLTARSPYLERLINGSFREHNQGLVTLEDEDVEATLCMVRYLAMDPDGPNWPDYSISSECGSWQSSECARMHARVFSQGDQYILSALQTCALQKFRRTTRHGLWQTDVKAPYWQWCITDQVGLINLVYQAPTQNRLLRDEVVGCVVLMCNELVDRLNADPACKDVISAFNTTIKRYLWALQDGRIPTTITLSPWCLKYETNPTWRELDPQHQQKAWHEVLLSHQKQLRRQSDETFRLQEGVPLPDLGIEREEFMLTHMVKLYHRIILGQSQYHYRKEATTTQSNMLGTLRAIRQDIIPLIERCKALPSRKTRPFFCNSKKLIALLEKDTMESVNSIQITAVTYHLREVSKEMVEFSSTLSSLFHEDPRLFRGACVHYHATMEDVFQDDLTIDVFFSRNNFLQMDDEMWRDIHRAGFDSRPYDIPRLLKYSRAYKPKGHIATSRGLELALDPTIKADQERKSIAMEYGRSHPVFQRLFGNHT